MTSMRQALRGLLSDGNVCLKAHRAIKPVVKNERSVVSRPFAAYCNNTYYRFGDISFKAVKVIVRKSKSKTQSAVPATAYQPIAA